MVPSPRVVSMVPTPGHLPPTRLGAALVLAVFAAACGGKKEFTGTVVDPWGAPVADATVIMEGVAEEQVTDEDGHFSFEVQDGMMNVLAGKDGYIKAAATFRASRSKNASLPAPELVLYPDPKDPGFYAIDPSGYARLDTSLVKSVGTELTAYTGLGDVGGVSLPSDKPLRVVFSTDLRRADISRLDLRLTHLNFVDHRAIADVYGTTDVTINLWTPDEDVPFDLTALYSGNDYLLTSRGNLAPGAYAFHIQSVLTDPDVHHLERTPREMRVAYPFELR